MKRSFLTHVLALAAVMTTPLTACGQSQGEKPTGTTVGQDVTEAACKSELNHRGRR